GRGARGRGGGGRVGPPGPPAGRVEDSGGGPPIICTRPMALSQWRPGGRRYRVHTGVHLPSAATAGLRLARRAPAAPPALPDPAAAAPAPLAAWRARSEAERRVPPTGLRGVAAL